MTELEALLVLNAVTGLGGIRIRKLLDCFGSGAAAIKSNRQDLIAAGILPGNVVSNFIKFNKDEFLKKEYDLINKHGIKVISFRDKNYPAHLKEIPDSPVVLYVKGTVEKENDLSIALVGSRRASFYGLSVAEKLAAGLADLGITVVSGMARGIDGAAHRGALRAGGATLAVLGCGLSHIYPPEHKKLFEEIAAHGAVVSEFSMAMAPLAANFPKRNRIISGLCLGVVVVEASVKDRKSVV